METPNYPKYIKAEKMKIKKIQSEFKKMFKLKIEPKLKIKKKIDSEINKLESEIDKLNSEIDKLYSEIFYIFYKFGKENDCVVDWENYEFKLEGIKLKFYNKDKTGFVFIDMQGKITEELFETKELKLEDLTKEQLILKIKELEE